MSGKSNCRLEGIHCDLPNFALFLFKTTTIKTLAMSMSNKRNIHITASYQTVPADLRKTFFLTAFTSSL